MSLSIYSKASVDSLLSAKANLAGATFTGAITATNFTLTAGAGGVITFADGTTQSTAGGGGGGASWGSITGSISAQTDLQTEFGNYLPLAGGTMTGGLTVASAGITFADSSVQTTAATTFTGGSISSPITAGNMTTDSYFGPDLIGIELTGTSQNSVLYYNGLSVTDGSSTASFNLSGIYFADGSSQSTAGLPISGGTMTGSLNLAAGATLTSNGGTSYFINGSSISFTNGLQSLLCTGGYFNVLNASTGSQVQIVPDGIYFPDGSFQNTSAGGTSYLPLSGGTMTGAIYSNYGSQSATFFANNISSNDGGYQCLVAPYYFYTTNGSASTYITPTYIQFADGSTQTTAATGGMDYAGAERAGICAALALAFDNFDGSYTFDFNTQSSSPVGGGSQIFYSAPDDTQVIGITQDFSNYYVLVATSTSGKSIQAQAPDFSGLFNSSVKIYLAFKDQFGTWHTAYNCCVYSP